tara:strand:+ start:829 stop:1191 length:363 start_codon:yes stop_codon:yes gene_type:complete
MSFAVNKDTLRGSVESWWFARVPRTTMFSIGGTEIRAADTEDLSSEKLDTSIALLSAKVSAGKRQMTAYTLTKTRGPVFFIFMSGFKNSDAGSLFAFLAADSDVLRIPYYHYKNMSSRRL